MNLIEMVDVSVCVREKSLVAAVDLCVDAGSWFGLVGANGSGKTTLLRCLAGRSRPSAGRIHLSGRDVTGDSSARAQFFGFTTDIDRLPQDLTARELVALVKLGRAASCEPSDLRETLGLDGLYDLRVGDMSSGMKQRVSIFLAFIGTPQAVILDEPFNWLDPVVSYELKLNLVERVRAGQTLITAVHDITTFATHCAAGIVMSEGKVVRRYDFKDVVGTADPVILEKEIYEALLPESRTARGTLARP